MGRPAGTRHRHAGVGYHRTGHDRRPYAGYRHRLRRFPPGRWHPAAHRRVPGRRIGLEGPGLPLRHGPALHPDGGSHHLRPGRRFGRHHPVHRRAVHRPGGQPLQHRLAEPQTGTGLGTARHCRCGRCPAGRHHRGPMANLRPVGDRPAGGHRVDLQRLAAGTGCLVLVALAARKQQKEGTTTAQSGQSPRNDNDSNNKE